MAFSGFQSNEDKLKEAVKASRAYQKEYYIKNREQKLKYAKEYKEKHRDEINYKRRVSARLEGVSERKSLGLGILSSDKKNYNKLYHYEVKILQRLKERILAFQIVSGEIKPRCCVCGETNIYVLCINHKNGGGRKEFLKSSYRSFLSSIISRNRSVSDLDIRCQNCNILYEYERGYRKYHPDWEILYKDLTDV